ncbi:MAG: hypothetical protein NVS9B8_12400 [Candidatus Limnocylindrales bacterium]
MGIEARVGPDRELPGRPGMADPADRLAQEVPGTPRRVCPALAQAGHQDDTGSGRDREERVIAADMGVPVVAGALLLEAVRLADRRVEIDRERIGDRTGTGRPGPGEELPTDPVELADVTPAKAAQERAQGRGRLDGEAEDPLRPAGPQGIRVVDAIAARERRHDERQELLADVRPTGFGAQVQMLVDEPLEAEVLGEGGRQEEPSIGHELRPVKHRRDAVQAVGRSHPSGAPLVWVDVVSQHHHSRSDGHLFCCPGS